MTLSSQQKQTLIQQDGRVLHSSDDPFMLLKEQLARYPSAIRKPPFCGGAIGYFAYDLVRYLEQLPSTAENKIAIPDMAIGLYDWAIISDHQLRQTYIVTTNQHPKTPTIIRHVKHLLDQPTPIFDDFQLIDSWRANMDKRYYMDALAHIHQHLRQGDCYQTNFVQWFNSRYRGNPWHAYQHLRRDNPAPFAAYLHYPSSTILSLSPERFIRVQNNIVESQPIKGTRPRSTSVNRDKQLAQELLNSSKDRAENLMIVDLIRNDLGKNCAIGSIQVPQLCTLHSFPAVHHLVSTVTGQLAAGKHSLDVLRGCFPGGSITGAPKLSAMQIIETLEPQRRSLYCGSIGCIDFNGDMDSNIAIRSIICHDKQLHCAAGGGIIFDSNAQQEYQETLDKIALIKDCLMNFRVYTEHEVSSPD